MSESKFPPMEIEHVGNKVYATMTHNGLTESVRVPLQYIYMDKEAKLNFLKVNKIVNQLLKKVGFDF